MNDWKNKKSALVGYSFDENLMRSIKGDSSLRDSLYNRERNLEGYYLRSAVINLFNSTVSMSFNCDGTQIMSHKKFKEFIEDYI